MFSNILFKIQDKTGFLYENSIFLQKIDFFILCSILSVFLVSTVMQSDYIGFVAFVTMFLTFVKLITKRGEKFSFNIFEILILVYFMFVVVSLAGSTLFALSLKGFLKTFIYIGFYFSTAHYLKGNKDKIPIILAVISGCVGFESSFAFIQNFAQVEAISTWQDTTLLNPEEIMTRVYGTLKPYNPNLLGGYFVLGIPSIIGLFAYFASEKKYNFAAFTSLLACLSIASLFLTGCRGAYLSLLFILTASFVVSAKFFWQNYKRWYFSFVGGALCLFTSALIFITSLRARFLSIFAMRNDSSNSFRFNVYQSSIQMFCDNWLLGIGVGNKNFREIYGLYMKTGFDALSAYNVFLEIAVESGIFALLAFTCYLFVCVKYAIRFIMKSENIKDVIFVSTALIAVLAAMLHGFVDTVFFRPQVQFIYWTMVAIISAFVSSNTQVLIEDKQ